VYCILKNIKKQSKVVTISGIEKQRLPWLLPSVLGGCKTKMGNYLNVPLRNLFIKG